MILSVARGSLKCRSQVRAVAGDSPAPHRTMLCGVVVGNVEHRLRLRAAVVDLVYALLTPTLSNM